MGKRQVSYPGRVNPDDPRVQRTRERLRAALLSLAAETELDDVTMSAVARRAEVNRATVYQHYADLDALVSDAMEDAVAYVARCAALCPLDAPRDRVPEPLADLFGHVADNAVLYRRTLSGHGSARFANRLRERLAKELAARFEEGARPPGFDDVPVRTHATYLAGALVGVITDWVGAGTSEAPGETALAAWRLLRG
nr:TetR/AcrR family transcriptional regulator [Nocardiopsis sinuspersici]